MKKLNTIARAIVAKNPALVAVVAENPGKSYKALESRITARFVTKVGRQEDQFLSRNKLIWAIIDECSDEDDEGLDY